MRLRTGVVAVVVVIAVAGASLLVWSRVTRWPPRFREPTSSEAAHLSALDATGVVTAYFSSRDPQQRYWLLAGRWRADWLAATSEPDLELDAGVDSLAVTRVVSAVPPKKGTLVFDVRYRSRIPNVIGEGPGSFRWVVGVSRQDAGRWRIESMSDGV